MKGFLCIFLICFSLAASAQCTFSLGSDVTYCQGQTINSVFSAPAGQSSYAWSTGATTQSITATAAGVYTCTVTLLSSNLVTNANFSSGNTGFSSGYTVGSGGSWGPISNPGTYYITNNANSAHSNFPSFSGHGGSGNMMVCNGSDIAGTSVWCTSITVTPNTTYNFSSWAATCVNGTAAELADLQFSINNTLIGSQYSPSMTPGAWTQFNATWNSGASTTANICIINQNTTASGNDFALDDIFFQQVCTANDAVQVIVNPKPTVTVPTNTVVCPGTVIPATALVSNPAGASYTWTNSNTAIGLAASGNGDVPSFTTTNTSSAAISGVISVTPTLNSCTGNPTNYTVTVNPIPVLSAIPNQTVCVNNSTAAINFNSTPPGATVNWTNTDPTIGLSAGSSGDIASFPGQNPGATAITGTISATPTLNNCAGNPITFNITVSPAPTLNAIASQTVCPGNPTTAISFTTNPAGITSVNWTNSDGTIGIGSTGSGDIASFTAINASSSTINAIITATPSIGTCVGSSQTFTITVDPKPDLNTVTSQTLCVNNTTALVSFSSTPSGASVNWTNSEANIGLAASGSGDIASFIGQNPGSTVLTGNITATPTLNSCIGDPITFDIIVSPGPTLSTVTSQTVCPGIGSTPVTFNTVPAEIATINWTNSAPAIGIGGSGVGDIASFTATNTSGSAIVGTFNATPSIGTCIGNVVTFSITVDPAPTVNAIANANVCNINIAPASSFSGTAGATFNWTNSNTNTGLGASGTGDYASFTATNITTAAISSAISVTPVLNGCFGNPTSYTLTVNPTPAPPATNTVAPYCLNAPASLLTALSSTGGSLLWWGTSAAGGTSSTTATLPSTATDGTTVYYVSQTVLGCESPRAAITVTVNPLPVINDPVDTAVCSGVNVPARSFTSTPGGATLNWVNNNTAIGLAASGTGNVPAFTSTNSGYSTIYGIITVTPNLNSCTGTPISYSVTIDPIPVVNVSNITTCNNASVPTINWSSNPAGATYTWTNSNTSIGVAGSGTSSINSFTATNSGITALNSTVNVTPTLGGCAGQASTFTITVNPTPAAPFVSNNSYCQNETATTLSPSGPGYLWYISAAGGTGSSTAPTPSTSSPGSNSYYVTQTVNGCESPRSTITITTKNLPTATLATVTPSCPPLCTKLALSSPDNLIAYNWQLGDGGTFAGNDTVPNHCYNLSGSYTVAVTIKDVNNCENTISFPGAVLVADVPEALFSFTPQPTTIIDPTITFTNMSTGARPLSYQWNFGTEPGTFVTTENPGYTYESIGNYTVQLITTNGYGCTDTLNQVVVIADDIMLYVPTAFSPNGDGVNDSFYAKGVGIDEKNFSMLIFDRWGEMIFQSSGLNDAWNGKVNDKALVSNDIFVWKIVYKSQTGEKLLKSGHVTLVK